MLNCRGEKQIGIIHCIQFIEWVYTARQNCYTQETDVIWLDPTSIKKSQRNMSIWHKEKLNGAPPTHQGLTSVTQQGIRCPDRKSKATLEPYLSCYVCAS